MNIIGINGSPRKNWNTATLVQKALDGAASRGAETGLFHLYDLSYRGCISCFACKTIGGPSYGKCAMRDGLTPLLEKVGQADGLVLGSPIYYGTVTGEMRSFMERLFFPYSTYTDPPGTLFPRKIGTCFIYTLGATEELAKERGFHHHIDLNEMILRTIFGASESLMSYDTYQFEDYSKIYAPRFNPGLKAKRRKEVFPLDCEKAYEMGKRVAG
ncbi:MAG TPA: flavodoxin family protein [Syntrophorhabdaceae bacterium]|jgi:multimeric flavodoxin WrbA